MNDGKPLPVCICNQFAGHICPVHGLIDNPIKITNQIIKEANKGFNLAQRLAEQSINSYYELKEKVLKQVVPEEFHEPEKFLVFATLHQLRFIVRCNDPNREELWLDYKLVGVFISNEVMKDEGEGLRIRHIFHKFESVDTKIHV